MVDLERSPETKIRTSCLETLKKYRYHEEKSFLVNKIFIRTVKSKFMWIVKVLKVSLKPNFQYRTLLGLISPLDF